MLYSDSTLVRYWLRAVGPKSGFLQRLPVLEQKINFYEAKALVNKSQPIGWTVKASTKSQQQKRLYERGLYESFDNRSECRQIDTRCGIKFARSRGNRSHGKESNCIQVDPWNNHRSGTVVTKTGGESLQFCEPIRITGVIQSTFIEYH